MTQSMDEQKLLRRLSALPLEVEPDNDVWAGISERISAVDPAKLTQDQGIVPAYRSAWPYALAASITLLMAVGFFMQTADQASVGIEPLAGSNSDLPVNSVDFAFIGLDAGIEPEYQAAFREFMALNPIPEYLDESESLWVAKVWGGLREAEIELSAALAVEPQSRFLNTRMTSLRAHQLDLLKHIADMDKVSRRNTI